MSGRRRRPASVRPLWTTPGQVVALAAALSFGVAAWTTVMRAAGLVQQHDAESLGRQWLSAGLVALPLVLAAVAVALRAVRALARLTGGGDATALRVSAVAFGAALAGAVADPLYTWVAGTHVERSTSGVLAFAQDALVGLVAALPLAVAADLAARWYHRTGELPELDEVAGQPDGAPLLRRVPAAAAAFSLVLLGVGVGPAATVASAAGTEVCPSTAPVKHFDVTAIDIKIPLNRFGDNNPTGKMYVLNSKLAAARAEEQTQQVSIGLRDDPIQPLSIRANEGDCVEIAFTNNASGGDYGMHIDGVAFDVRSSGDAVGDNTPSSVPRGGTVTYRYYVPNDPRMEGSHYIHPGPGFRDAIGNGLFGELTVEPPGSTYLDPNDGSPLDSGWEAMIVPGNGAAPFREYVLMFHVYGNDNNVLFDRNGAAIPQVDNLTDTYRPSAFAINYRSESFRNRVAVNEHEEADAYGSYTFGDPSTPMPRGYLADPAKIRLDHTGAEKFHAFHLHGGGIRWRQNPVADPTWNYADTGLQKDPVTKESPSMRNDSQAVGPGESYNLEIEGGNGGVQQAVGDFLFHCHIVKHYVAGMWSFWRVYNTKQADLQTLPGRVSPPDAVDSTGLIGRTMPDGTTITAQNIDQWIRPMLPPPGVRHNDQDAAVMDWTVDKSDPANPLYLNEPEDLTDWPDSAKVIPGHPNLQLGDRLVGNRPVILFDPTTGRPAFPLLRTHVGNRPPFAPNGHSGAPYLGENANAPKTSAVDPYANRADGLCPQGRTLRRYNAVAITKPIKRNDKDTDPNGEIYVLANHKAAVLAGTYPDDPLAIRANQGDCVAVTLTNELNDATTFGGFNKVNIHIHHVQFDVQGSDGVITGFNFETAVRPYKVEDPQLTASAAAGSTTLSVGSAAKFQVGEYIGVGLGTDGIEINQIAAIKGKTLTLVKPLTRSHPAGEWAGTEFVQYRWYPDVVLDNIFFHDHVDAIHTWAHGLVGMFIVEPAGSTYHDPKTGAEVDSGTIVDIHTTNPLSPGLVDGSFREMALWTIDDNNDDSQPSSLNLRTAPLDRRNDTNYRFSSYVFGDPATPLPRAYPGDPIVVRTINSGPTLDTLHFDGARYLPEFRMTDATGAHNAEISDTLSYSTSERFTLVLGGPAGGTGSKPGDYLYFNGDDRRLQQGAWGIIRVLPGRSPDLQPLPDNPAPATTYVPPTVTGGRPPAASGPGNPCPAGAPLHSFNVSAVDLPSGNNALGAFVPTSQSSAVRSGSIKPEPLVLHVAAGECVQINLKNERNGRGVSFAVSKLQKDIGSIGVNVGFDPEQNVAAGATRTYVYYADSDHLGTATIANLGGEDNLLDPNIGPPIATKRGFYGALVVGQADAKFTDPATGAATDVGTQVDVHVAGTHGYRDATLILADDDPQMGQDHMPYPTFAETQKTMINYRFANGGNVTDGNTAFTGTPATPLVRAYAGDPLLVHEVIAPGSEQGHVFSLGGMSAPHDRFIPNSERIDNMGLGPWASFDAEVIGGAGGVNHTVGDFFYGDLRRPFTQVGAWGLIRVMSDASCPIRPLDGLTCTGS
jgi:manganese oxidase